MLCYRPSWYRGALGRQTDFRFNAAGQLIEQADPPDASGVRRKTYITYDTTSGISRRSVVRICGDTTTCGTSAEIRTEYEYWAKTLLPSVERRIDAARGEVLETRYTYDAAGRRRRYVHAAGVDEPSSGTRAQASAIGATPAPMSAAQSWR